MERDFEGNFQEHKLLRCRLQGAGLSFLSWRVLAHRPVASVVEACGTTDRNRTGTPAKAKHFKCFVSTNFTTVAHYVARLRDLLRRIARGLVSAAMHIAVGILTCPPVRARPEWRAVLQGAAPACGNDGQTVDQVAFAAAMSHTVITCVIDASSVPWV